MSPFDRPDEPADLTLEEQYARLERKYLNLLDRYRHARAAIDNDIWLADEMARRKASKF